MRWVFKAGTAIAASVLLAGPVRADDLVTLSGKTYHDVHPLRVDPDGVTWRYAEGICKVDFSDSPPGVCKAFHYDPVRAAAYHDAQTQARRQSEEQTRQLLQADDERQRTRAAEDFRGSAPASPAGPGVPPLSGSPTLVYRHGLAPEIQAAARSLGEQMDARKAQAAADARNSEGLGNPAIWKYVPGIGPKPVPPHFDVANALEYRVSLHNDPVSVFPTVSAENTFFTPLYQTKGYNEDVDRAAAFARGVPLK